MTLPRAQLIDPYTTHYYHCVSRCVRRAYLCGRDALTGYDFEHRRHWIEKRMLELAEVFTIDVCAYAVMSNHYHLVLHLNLEEQASLDDASVIDRWALLCKLPGGFDSFDTPARAAYVARCRRRLGSISWFMKFINEPLARWANREDGCKGRFWEGRFRSQALLDEAAVLKCMAYVDLNPIRAGIAKMPETSAHTSINARINGRDQSLAPMADAALAGEERFTLPIRSADYLQLVDWTGRQFRKGKRGRIDPSAPPVVERLERASPRSWLDEMTHLTRHYHRAIGNVLSLARYRQQLGQTRLWGLAG